jgi:hypothetical protein
VGPNVHQQRLSLKNDQRDSKKEDVFLMIISPWIKKIGAVFLFLDGTNLHPRTLIIMKRLLRK